METSYRYDQDEKTVFYVKTCPCLKLWDTTRSKKSVFMLNHVLIWNIEISTRTERLWKMSKHVLIWNIEISTRTKRLQKIGLSRLAHACATREFWFHMFLTLLRLLCSRMPAHACARVRNRVFRIFPEILVRAWYRSRPTPVRVAIKSDHDILPWLHHYFFLI